MNKDLIINDVQTYVSGAIVTDQGQPINGASVQLYAGNNPLTDPYIVNGSYSAWTDQDPTTIFVVFRAVGYKSQKTSIDKLEVAPDIIMEKGGLDIPAWQIALIILGILIYISKDKKNKNKIGKFDSSDALAIMIIIGGIVGISIIMKVLKALGLGGDPTASTQADPGSWWTPTYWQQFSTYTYAITESVAGQYAYIIHNAFGITQDDYNQVYGVFSQMKTKANVSFLAWKFQKEYSEDLLTFLTDGGGILPWDGLSATHLETILKLVGKLPTN